MSYRIFRVQNTERQLNRLAAQRLLYSDAKKLIVAQAFLTVPVTVTLSILKEVFPQLTVWSGFYGLMLVFLGAALDYYGSSLRTQAAKIQELFDCDVLRISWQAVTVGPRPDAETVEEALLRFRERGLNIDRFKDWYPTIVDSVPIYLARLICQRLNVRWDSQLRRWFANGISIAALATAICVLVVGIAGGMTLPKFVVAVLAPTLPVILWGLAEYLNQTRTAQAQERLKSYIEDLWSKAIGGDLAPKRIETESRNLQDEIFRLRESSPLVLDIVYESFRRIYDIQADKGAKEFVHEFLQARKPR